MTVVGLVATFFRPYTSERKANLSRTAGVVVAIVIVETWTPPPPQAKLHKIPILTRAWMPTWPRH